MSLMRSVLLRGSRSTRLRELLPRFRFVRRAVGRFMPGEEISDALTAAETLRTNGIASVVTHLGENLSEAAEANEVAGRYLTALKLIRQRELDCQISVKLTQLGLDLGGELCCEHLAALLRRARELGNFVWIDMESSPYVDKTLDIYRRAREEFPNVGVCLQAYLYRTAADIEALLPLGPSIRLVKGTYAEPADVAFRSKRDVDRNYFNLSKRLLRSHAQLPRIAVATHDRVLLRSIDQFALREGIARDSYEIQMLYGIQRESQLQFRRDGFRVRILISYGTFWFPWYMRRLAERPANVLFVLRNLVSR
ncbi:MAG: proline dehydrogenase [Ignavibacteria bacterium]|nr:MAG: proline dehydrogenase [Ignavibacteria bacterium]